MIYWNRDPVSASVKRVNTLLKWRGASYGAVLCVTDAQIHQLRELAAELHALYADASGQSRHSPIRNGEIAGTICELLRLHESFAGSEARQVTAYGDARRKMPSPAYAIEEKSVSQNHA
jgi:hypothetical protein